MDGQTVRNAVRELRYSIPPRAGAGFERLSQTEFGRMLGIGVQTVIRYETFRVPKGPMLVRLANLARETGRRDLCVLFFQALFDELDLREVPQNHAITTAQKIALEVMLFPDDFPEAMDLFQQMLAAYHLTVRE